MLLTWTTRVKNCDTRPLSRLQPETKTTLPRDKVDGELTRDEIVTRYGSGNNHYAVEMLWADCLTSSPTRQDAIAKFANWLAGGIESTLGTIGGQQRVACKISTTLAKELLDWGTQPHNNLWDSSTLRMTLAANDSGNYNSLIAAYLKLNTFWRIIVIRGSNLFNEKLWTDVLSQSQRTR